MSILLRDGSTTTSDPRLDRIVQFDEASRAYGIMEIIEKPVLRSRDWPVYAFLNQGQEGHCVAFGWAHEYAGEPVVVKGMADAWAHSLFLYIAERDEYPGDPRTQQGTSVLAGAKASQALGFLGEYRWAFGIDDLLLALGHHGPGVLGIPWLGGMFTPRPSGLLEVSRLPGDIKGGHCIAARGVYVNGRLPGEAAISEPVVKLRNSWGSSWGAIGDCYIKASDLEWLLAQQGEACIPVQRKRPVRLPVLPQ